MRGGRRRRVAGKRHRSDRRREAITTATAAGIHRLAAHGGAAGARGDRREDERGERAALGFPRSVHLRIKRAQVLGREEVEYGRPLEVVDPLQAVGAHVVAVQGKANFVALVGCDANNCKGDVAKIGGHDKGVVSGWYVDTDPDIFAIFAE